MTTATLQFSANNYVDWWQQTHASRQDAQTMWESSDRSFRDHLVGAVRLCLPATSLYELGCGAGPNLRRLRAACPDLILGASEPCDPLAAWVEEHLSITPDRTALPEPPLGQWDLLVSCYVLSYLDDQEVTHALRALHRPRPQALILLEPDMGAVGFEGLGYRMNDATGEPFLPVWFHDYPKLLPATGWTIQWRWPFPQTGALVYTELRTIVVAVPA